MKYRVQCATQNCIELSRYMHEYIREQRLKFIDFMSDCGAAVFLVLISCIPETT